MTYIIRDMVSGDLVGSEITRSPFSWHGDNGECRTKPVHGLELKDGETVIQKLYEINDAQGSAYKTAGALSYDSGSDSVTRPQEYKSLPDCKAVKDGEINTLRDQKRHAGSFSTGLGWNADLRNGTDETNISGKALQAAVQLIGSDASAITSKGADNVERDLTPAQMIAVGQAMGAAITAVYTQSWVHKAAVDALTTPAAVEAYDITAGW